MLIIIKLTQALITQLYRYVATRLAFRWVRARTVLRRYGYCIADAWLWLSGMPTEWDAWPFQCRTVNEYGSSFWGKMIYHRSDSYPRHGRPQPNWSTVSGARLASIATAANRAWRPGIHTDGDGMQKTARAHSGGTVVQGGTSSSGYSHVLVKQTSL